MPYGYIRDVTSGTLTLVEWIPLDTNATPPPRPHPQPPDPVDPNAPRPSHPIALPGDPWWGGDLKPTHPIALPGDPWFPPPTGGGEQPPAGGVVAVVTRAPEGAPATPPEGLQLSPAMVDFGKGTKPAQAWIGPYPSTGPV